MRSLSESIFGYERPFHIKTMYNNENCLILLRSLDMKTITTIYLLLLGVTCSSSMQQIGDRPLRNRIKEASSQLGIPQWKLWDLWWQFHSCK